nr:MAG TPA: hypothetical protein [Crassvirales sp.]
MQGVGNFHLQLIQKESPILLQGGGFLFSFS